MSVIDSTNPDRVLPLSEGAKEVLREYSSTIERTLCSHAAFISQEAWEQSAGLVHDRPPRQITAQHVAQAIVQFELWKPRRTLLERLLDFASSVMGISVILAITFGVLGFLATSGRLGLPNEAGSFLDLAKLFAGAVVGSTGAAAVRSIKQQGSKR